MSRSRDAAPGALTEADRRLLAQGKFNLAMIHFEEARKLARKGGTPNACVHAAYYAMHHCAAAAILASGGVGKRRDSPPSHEGVIEHFGKLSQTKAGYLAKAGLALSQARAERVIADYGVIVGGASGTDAKALSDEADRFVEACRAEWDFVLPADDGERAWLKRRLEQLDRS